MRKNGQADERFGDSKKAGIKKAGKKAMPPSVGVGRVCHLSLFGTATQRHCVARRPASGTRRRLIRNDMAVISSKSALSDSAFTIDNVIQYF